MGTLNQGNIHQFVIKQKNTEDNPVSDTTKTTTNKVIQLFSKDSSKSSNEDSIESNNKKALRKQIPHRFSISQTLNINTDGTENTVRIEMIENIWLSIEEIEESELETLVDVAREKFITKILNNEYNNGYINDKFDISKESNFKLLWTVWINWFVPSETNYLKEM